MSAVQDAYTTLGTDYNDVLKRLMNEQLIVRFLKTFLDDASFVNLREALDEDDVKAAFMAAHTLKGVCQNLGLSNLFTPINELTELLRTESLEGAEPLFKEVELEYNKTISVLKQAL